MLSPAPRPRRGRPEAQTAPVLGLEIRPRRLESGARLGHGQRRPDGEIPGRRRPVTGDEAPRQFRQRLVPRQVARAGRSLLEQHVRVLLADPRTAADERVELGGHEEVRQPLPLDADAGGAEHAGGLGAGQPVPAAQRREEGAGAPPQRLIVQPELGVPARVPCADARRGRGQQPADVGRQHEVPRRPQHVRAQDRAGAEGALHLLVRSAGHARAQGPLGRPVVLGLDRPEEADGLLGRRAGHAGQALRAQPACDDIPARVRVHPSPLRALSAAPASLLGAGAPVLDHVVHVLVAPAAQIDEDRARLHLARLDERVCHGVRALERRDDALPAT